MERSDKTREYTYDALGRLIQSIETDNNAETGGETTAYTYDAAGNRLTETKGGKTTSYSYNGLNQLTKATETGEGVNAVRTYTYDTNGNQTVEVMKEGTVESQRRTFTYDEANRLTGLTVKEGDTITLTQTNRYRGDGQRIEKEETKLIAGLEGESTETTKTDYYYQNGAVLYTENEEGSISSMNLLGASDNIIATSRGTGDNESWYLYNKDIRESTSSIIGADGEAAATYEYDDFGNTTVTSGADFDNEICYTGQVYDRSSGLYYYNARYYDPENGRFITQDTYRGENTEPATLHLYAYCANNPINYVDPSGHARQIPNRDYSTTYYLGYRPPFYSKAAIMFSVTVTWKVRKKEIKNYSRKIIADYVNYKKRNHPWRYHKSSTNVSLKNGKQRGRFTAKIVIKNIQSGSLTSKKLGLWFYNDGGRDWD